MPIPFAFQVASLLAVLTHPGHSFYKHTVIYAPGDEFSCRRDATNPLGINLLAKVRAEKSEEKTE
ncbi:hypothetical protein [Xenorhabdus sp. PB30.3]|uniref:hypothetical protein n=1 Tax=Xenorhabdus sp. PB30.3 TaxID=2788941 RepID=UPI001E415F70|nr:hypothetical protein [Xenorhabdus sp. PB30.3]MCC8381340.1 hypothetical protein [Xenorhabdus sp. PB30.3]